MVDAHCHVDLFPDPLNILRESDKLGIYTIAVTNLPSHFKLGYAHVRSFKKTRLSLGLHPLHALKHQQELPLFIECLPLTSYIGEVGLDFSKEGVATKSIQIDSFKKILAEISTKHKLLSIHSRGAEKEVLDLLVQYKIKNAIFHWYSGSINLIESIINAGYLFSINSAMTASLSGKNIIRAIPTEYILTETDGPFIHISGKPATPKDVRNITYEIASIKKESKDKIEHSINDRFRILISNITSK